MRSTARNPIFDVLINYISSRQVALPQLDDLVTGSLETHETESKFSMTLYIRGGCHAETRIGVSNRVVFQRARGVHAQSIPVFTRADLRRPGATAACVFARGSGIARAAARSIGANSCAAHGLTVDAIADWAQRTPGKTALYHDGKALSYGELWQAAQAIASEMRAQGLKRSDVVAISGPRASA